ncbi:right-handed parallel beta-helix repeat-containing protein [Candidatus Woesearchaeota archaeon]|nr:right-handed parallel beta-helix repeat-containing protein [Candidatus Woesearchaeota archaeon]
MLFKKRLLLLLLTILPSIILSASVSAIQITSLSELYGSDTLRIFEFNIKNNNTAALDSVNWSFDTRNNNIINNTQNVSLAVDENLTVFVAYNFSGRGTFVLNATAFNGTLTDSEFLTVIVSDIVITDLNYLYLNQTEFIFEFVVNNTAATTLTGINWSISMGDSTTINSITPFNLSSGENIRVYIHHNYTTIGRYIVTASAYDSINNYSTTLSVKTNTTPVISPLSDVTFFEDQYNDTVNLSKYVTDEDSPAELTWTVTGNSSSTVRVNILSNSRINLTSAPNYNNELAGGINITFTVTDTDGLIDNDTVLVIVKKLNDPPNITWYTPENLVVFVPVNDELQFNHTSEDIDSPTLYYNWSLDGTTQSTSQAWLYQPTMADTGDHIVNLTVTDGELTDSIQWNITVYITYCNGNYNATMTQWIINSNVLCQNETIPFAANLIVQNNGNLTFRNITLQVNNSVNGQYGITIQSGGKMYILDKDNDKSTANDRSVIERGGTSGYSILANPGAVFEMKNSKLTGAGWNAVINNRGLEISADNVIIENSEITTNYNGLTILSNSNLIENNDFVSNTNYGIYVTGLNNKISNNIINTSLGSTGILAENIPSNLLIDNNIITSPVNKACIEFDNVDQSNITNNNITLCSYGIFFESTQLIDSSTNNFIKGNMITQSSKGIYFKTALNNKILNTLISGNTRGIEFQNGTQTEPGSDNNIIQDSVISSSSEYDIYYSQKSGNNTLINTTFTISKVDSDGGNLTVKWHLDVYVNDSNGNNANNAMVNGYDRNNNLEFSESTNSSGWIRRQIMEELSFLPDQPPPKKFKHVYKTNYTITASNSSYKATAAVNLTESKSITLTIEPVPLYIHNLSVLNASEKNRTFEFLITNQLTANITDISWQFDTKDNNIINSINNIILIPGETIFTYIKYNFSTTGTYNVNATAINGSLKDSINLNVTIS